MAEAKARQQPLTAAMKAQVRAQNRLVGSQKSRGKGELVRLRESLKTQARTASGKKVQAVLNQIKTRYGNAQLQKALREFNLTFAGIQRDPEEGKSPRPERLPYGR